MGNREWGGRGTPHRVQAQSLLAGESSRFLLALNAQIIKQRFPFKCRVSQDVIPSDDSVWPCCLGQTARADQTLGSSRAGSSPRMGLDA